MNRSRRVWDELLRAIEEAFAEFSGVSPDLIVHSPVIPEKTLPENGRLRPSLHDRRFAQETILPKNCTKRGEENGN